MLWVILAIVLVGATWLAILIVRNHREWKKAKGVVDALSERELEKIRVLIEQIGTVPSKGYVGLVRASRETAGRLSVTLPDDLADFPWRGKVVEAVAAPGKSEPVEFSIHEPPAQRGADEQPVFRWLAIPVIRVGQKQRAQNVFALDRYVSLSTPLRETLNELHPENPKLLLSLILSADGQHHSSEPFDQLRCGLPAGWIQSPRFHKCPACRRPMRLILQVPGALLKSRVAEGCFYLFGCPSHPDQTVTDQDWG